MNGSNERFDFTAPVPPLGDLGSVHFIAIGGAGMSGVARVMLARGCAVSGSDAKQSPVLAALAAEGADVHVGHDAAYVEGKDTVVISSAIRESNIELAAARARGPARAAPLPGPREHHGRTRGASPSPGPTARPRRPRC